MAARPAGHLYVGVTEHQRMHPVRNSFLYGVYFIHVDLAEVDTIARRLRFFSHNAFNLAALWDEDHGPRDGSPLRPWIDGLTARAGIDLGGGTVTLLAFPRVLGSRFYPVSFWYCHHADGTLRAILSEVSNTFHQHHNYLLHRGGEPLRWGDDLEAAKVFYVSPFIGMDGRYRFDFTEPLERLSVRILDTVGDVPLLTAAVKLERRPLDDAGLLAATLRYGPMSARAWLLIRWQAVKLLRKGLKYHGPEPLPQEETSL